MSESPVEPASTEVPHIERGALTLSDEQAAKLVDDLHPARIKTRSQGGAKLSYLEGFDVKATLIRIFGFGGFSAEVTESEIVFQEQYESTNSAGKTKELWRVAAKVTVRLTIHDPSHVSMGPTYTETAIAEQSGPVWGEAADFAVKTAETDALKRAAIYLGTQFGLSLYNDGSTRDVVSVVLADHQGAQVRSAKSSKAADLEKAKANMDRMMRKAKGEEE